MFKNDIRTDCYIINKMSRFTKKEYDIVKKFGSSQFTPEEFGDLEDLVYLEPADYTIRDIRLRSKVRMFLKDLQENPPSKCEMEDLKSMSTSSNPSRTADQIRESWAQDIETTLSSGVKEAKQIALEMDKEFSKMD